MTFKEIAFQDDLGSNGLAPFGEQESGLVQSLLFNQSPIIKLWAVLMIINLLMMMFML